MNDPIITVSNLTCDFGNIQAVRGISFTVYTGQVVGFIGANGAGKTTTMRMMATLEMPTSGRIKICGYDVVNSPNQVRHRVGWMPDSYGTYDNTTVLEYLDFYGRAFGYATQERYDRIQDVMEFADLAPIASRQMRTLSKGMAQRLCLGRTLIHDPAVLILDEPAAGLDPKARIEFKNLIRLLASRGKTVFISSHILTELGEMCDHLLFLDEGRIVHQGDMESLTDLTSGTVIVEVRVADHPQTLWDWVKVNPGVSLVEELRNGGRIHLDAADPEFLSFNLRKMIRDGVSVYYFKPLERRLEDAFIDMLKKEVKAS